MIVNVFFSFNKSDNKQLEKLWGLMTCIIFGIHWRIALGYYHLIWFISSLIFGVIGYHYHWLIILMVYPTDSYSDDWLTLPVPIPYGDKKLS